MPARPVCLTRSNNYGPVSTASLLWVDTCQKWAATVDDRLGIGSRWGGAGRRESVVQEPDAVGWPVGRDQLFRTPLLCFAHHCCVSPVGRDKVSRTLARTPLLFVLQDGVSLHDVLRD